MIRPVSDLKYMVQDNLVEFVKYFDGNLWYEVLYKSPTPDQGLSVFTFQFPVPIADIGNATFLKVDKAILFMRYIRKHLKAVNEAKEAQGG